MIAISLLSFVSATSLFASENDACTEFLSAFEGWIPKTLAGIATATLAFSVGALSQTHLSELKKIEDDTQKLRVEAQSEIDKVKAGLQFSATDSK